MLVFILFLLMLLSTLITFSISMYIRDMYGRYFLRIIGIIFALITLILLIIAL